MKITLQALFFFALLLSFGTNANGLYGERPSNPTSISDVGHFYGPSLESDLANYSSSFGLEGVTEEYNKSIATVKLTPSPIILANPAPCNEYSKWIEPTYANLSVKSSQFFTIDEFSNKGSLIDSDLSNYASWTGVLGGSVWIEVKDSGSANTYPAGTYASFVLSDFDLLAIGGNVEIKTYLGSSDTAVETYTVDNDLLSTFLGGGKKQIGFVTSAPFNRIRVQINSGLSVFPTYRVYYAEILKPCETGPDLECNTPTPLVQTDIVNNKPGHAVFIEPSRTGVSGALTIGRVKNSQNAVDPETNSFATLSLNVALTGSVSISIRDYDETYPAGHFAGFSISNNDFLSLDLLGKSRVRTYLNGVQQETSSLTKPLVDLLLLGGSDRHTVGFVTTLDFDEIRYTIDKTLSASLGDTKVYHAVVRRYCAGPELVCNTGTAITYPEYPVDLNMARTGISGGVGCPLCSLSNPENVLDGNENTAATIFMPINVGSTAGISVRNGFESYPEGTYVAFDVSNASLLNVELLGGISIELYENNVRVQTSSGTGDLIAVNTSIIGGVQHGLIGTVANVSFDEVRFVLTDLVGLTLGTTKVYNLVITKGCPGEFECQTSTSLTTPDYSVVVESARTGTEGVACVGCSIIDADKILSDIDTDRARIDLIAGLAASGSISVRDLSLEYPIGTTAGFVVKDPNGLFQLGLLSGITISTYFNGVIQESKSGSGQLIDLNVLLPWLGSGSEKRAVGFVTTKPFNEVRITYSTLLQAFSFLDVYYAFADGRFATGDGFDCNDFVSMNARNDINLTPVNLGVDGNVLTNDIGEGLDVTAGTYLDGSGTLQALSIGIPTNIYDAEGDLAGKITLNSNGTYRFNPEEDYTGKVTISYTAKDGNDLTDTADLTIKVVPLFSPIDKNPPIAINDNLITDKNVTVTGKVLENDTDLDNDHLTVTNINIGGIDYPVDLTNGAQATIIGVGTIDINADGIFTFIPALDYIGNVPSITYTVIDGNGGDDTANLNIKVLDRLEGVNSTYANDDANAALQGVTSMNGKVLENDFDPQGDNQLMVAGVASLHADGNDYTLTFGSTVTITNVGSFTLNSDGSYFFAPDPSFVGTLEMTYSIEDENNNGRPDYGEVAASSATLYLTIFARVEGVCISAKVLLQGGLVDLEDSGDYISDNIMRDDIRIKGLLPVNQPYNALPYEYQGTETVTDSSVFEDRGDNSIVDWVLLELRDKTDPSIIVARRAALVQRDGDIVTVDGVSCVRFEYYSGNYYLAVRHRNHLGAMSAEALDMTDDTVIYDFTLDALYDRADRNENPAFTRNGYQMLWVGDSNNDRVILYAGSDNDYTPIYEFIINHPDNIFHSDSFPVVVYSDFDLNLNGEVKADAIETDIGILERNILVNADGNVFNSDSYALFDDNLPN